MIKFRTGAVALLIASCVILPGAAYAQTSPSLSSLQAQINALIAQIAQLQAQLNALNASPTTGRTAAIDQNSLNALVNAPVTITGTASNVSNVIVYMAAPTYTGPFDYTSVSNAARGENTTQSADIASPSPSAVMNGRWSAYFGGWQQQTGARKVFVYDADTKALLIMGTLTITTASNPVSIWYFQTSPQTVGAGKSVALSWSSSGSDNCQIREGNSSHLIADAVGATGVYVVNPIVTTSYLLYCSHTSGGTVAFDSKSVSVTVTGSTPMPSTTTASASIDPSSLYSLSATPTITGTAANIQYPLYIDIDNGDKEFGSGDIAVVNGHWSLTLTKALSAGNHNVKAYSNNVLLSSGILTIAPQASTYIPPTYIRPTCIIGTSNPNAQVGQQITVTWTSQNATSAYLTPQGGSVATNGSATMQFANASRPAITLVLTGPGGTGACSTSVSVALAASTNPNLASALAAIQSAIDALKTQYSIH